MVERGSEEVRAANEPTYNDQELSDTYLDLILYQSAPAHIIPTSFPLLWYVLTSCCTFVLVDSVSAPLAPPGIIKASNPSYLEVGTPENELRVLLK
jgi:hypothetical protein